MLLHGFKELPLFILFPNSELPNWKYISAWAELYSYYFPTVNFQTESIYQHELKCIGWFCIIMTLCAVLNLSPIQFMYACFYFKCFGIWVMFWQLRVAIIIVVNIYKFSTNNIYGECVDVLANSWSAFQLWTLDHSDWVSVKAGLWIGLMDWTLDWTAD